MWHYSSLLVSKFVRKKFFIIDIILDNIFIKCHYHYHLTNMFFFSFHSSCFNVRFKKLHLLLNLLISCLRIMLATSWRDIVQKKKTFKCLKMFEMLVHKLVATTGSMETMSNLKITLFSTFKFIMRKNIKSVN